MWNRIKTKFKNKYFIIAILILLWMIMANEFYGIYIDNYNFGQLEKAKIILEQVPRNASKFYSLKEFNARYNGSIKPIKNCYFISNQNWKYSYIFWFKLESLTYRLIYGWNNNLLDYLYPTVLPYTYPAP